MPEGLRTVNKDGSLHYMDIGAQPHLILDLLDAQIGSSAIKLEAEKIKGKWNHPVGPMAVFKAVQQYIHDSTYHIRQQDRITLFGYVDFTSIPYQRELIDSVIQNIINGGLFHSYNRYHEWERDYEQGRCVGSKMGTLSISLRRSGLLFHASQNPPVQCVEEATIAGALVHEVAGIPLEDLVFFGSPVHTALFVRPRPGVPKGVIFDSKMLITPKTLKSMAGDNPEEKFARYVSKFDSWWFVARHGLPSTSPSDHPEIMNELYNFFGIT